MQGYARIPNDIFSLSLEGKELKVYIYLSAVSYAAGGGYMLLSISKIASSTGLSEASVKRALRAFEDRGILCTVKTYYEGKRHANRYKLSNFKSLYRGYIVVDLSLLCRMSGEKLLVYLCLCKHSNNKGKAYISERALADETGLSRNTVRKYTSELEAEGYIERKERLYCKAKETEAKRCFEYLIKAIPEPITLDAEQLIEVSDITVYIPPEYLLAVTALHLERILPLRVPP